MSDYCSDTWNYIRSVDGRCHNSAVEIIEQLHARLAAAEKVVECSRKYLKGPFYDNRSAMIEALAAYDTHTDES